jgi:hypothetical protein
MSLLKDSRGRLLIFILAILFSACQGGLVGNPYPDNQGRFLQITDSLRDLAKAGYITIDSSHAGNALIETMMVRVEPSYKQKCRIGWHNGTLTLFWILAAIGVALIIIGILYGNAGGRIKALPIVLHFTAVVIFVFAVWSIDFMHTKEYPIPKAQYDELSKTPDGVHNYIDQHLYE